MRDFTLGHGFVDWADGPLVIGIAERNSGLRASPPHRHARGQLFGAIRGLLTVGVEDAVWVVPSIHAVWLPPHREHWGRSHGPFEGWSVYVAEAACAALPAVACTVRLPGLLREAVLRAAQWPLVRAPLAPQRQRIAELIVDEIGSLRPEPLGLPLPAEPRLQKIARALADDPSDPRGLDAWADWAAVGARTLSRRFVTETGLTFTAWRQRARLLRSLEMLAADQPVNAIALDLGYATASAFIGVFRREFGVTPAVYRQRLKGELNSGGLR